MHNPEELKAPETPHPAGTADVYQFSAVVMSILNRDADELLALKERVRKLEGVRHDR